MSTTTAIETDMFEDYEIAVLVLHRHTLFCLYFAARSQGVGTGFHHEAMPEEL